MLTGAISRDPVMDGCHIDGVMGFAHNLKDWVKFFYGSRSRVFYYDYGLVNFTIFTVIILLKVLKFLFCFEDVTVFTVLMMMMQCCSPTWRWYLVPVLKMLGCSRSWRCYVIHGLEDVMLFTVLKLPMLFTVLKMLCSWSWRCYVVHGLEDVMLFTVLKLPMLFTVLKMLCSWFWRCYVVHGLEDAMLLTILKMLCCSQSWKSNFHSLEDVMLKMLCCSQSWRS